MLSVFWSTKAYTCEAILFFERVCMVPVLMSLQYCIISQSSLIYFIAFSSVCFCWFRLLCNRCILLL
jgi:hypothetical protein